MKFIGNLFLGFLMGGILVAVFWFMLTHDTTGKIPTPPVMVAVYKIPEPGAYKPIKLSGSVTPADPVVIMAGMEGRISRIVAKPGQILKKDAPVIYLDDGRTRLRYQQLQAQIANDQAEAQSQLFDDEPDDTPTSIWDKEETVTSTTPKQSSNSPLAPGTLEKITRKSATSTATRKETYEETETSSSNEDEETEEAPPPPPDTRERLAAIRSEMARHVIRMPEAGKVARILVEAGSRVEIDTPLIQVASRNPLQVEANIHRSILQLLSKDQPVDIRNHKAKAFAEGKITRIEIPEDEREPIGVLKVAFTKVQPGIFRNGHDVEVIAKLPMTNNIWIPVKAVAFREGIPVVFVVEQDNLSTHVIERPVELGGSDSGQIIVSSGLSPGEKIVIEHAVPLAHHQEVTVIGNQGRGR